MFSDSGRNYIRNKVRNFKNPFFDISFNLIYIYKFSYTITSENLMNNATSHLSSLLCKSSISKYMIMVRNITNGITKKNYIKLISHYHYGVVVYNFTHSKKWNIQSFLKGVCKDSLYTCVCVCVCVSVCLCKGKKKKRCI